MPSSWFPRCTGLFFLLLSPILPDLPHSNHLIRLSRKHSRLPPLSQAFFFSSALCGRRPSLPYQYPEWLVLADSSHISVSHSDWFSRPARLLVHGLCLPTWVVHREELREPSRFQTQQLRCASNSHSSSGSLISDAFSTLKTEWLFYASLVISPSWLKK